MSEGIHSASDHCAFAGSAECVHKLSIRVPLVPQDSICTLKITIRSAHIVIERMINDTCS